MNKIYSFQDIIRCTLYGKLVTECLREIDICILEDRHIARVVRNATKQLLQYLKEAISQRQYTKDSKGNMVKYGSFKTNLFGQELHIRWQIVFTDNDMKLPPCFYNEKTKTIALNLIETSQGINFFKNGGTYNMKLRTSMKLSNGKCHIKTLIGMSMRTNECNTEALENLLPTSYMFRARGK